MPEYDVDLDIDGLPYTVTVNGSRAPEKADLAGVVSQVRQNSSHKRNLAQRDYASSMSGTKQSVSSKLVAKPSPVKPSPVKPSPTDGSDFPSPMMAFDAAMEPIKARTAQDIANRSAELGITPSDARKFGTSGAVDIARSMQNPFIASLNGANPPLMDNSGGEGMAFAQAVNPSARPVQSPVEKEIQRRGAKAVQSQGLGTTLGQAFNMATPHGISALISSGVHGVPLGDAPQLVPSLLDAAGSKLGMPDTAFSGYTEQLSPLKGIAGQGDNFLRSLAGGAASFADPDNLALMALLGGVSPTAAGAAFGVPMVGEAYDKAREGNYGGALANLLMAGAPYALHGAKSYREGTLFPKNLYGWETPDGSPDWMNQRPYPHAPQATAFDGTRQTDFTPNRQQSINPPVNPRNQPQIADRSKLGTGFTLVPNLEEARSQFESVLSQSKPTSRVVLDAYAKLQEAARHNQITLLDAPPSGRKAFYAERLQELDARRQAATVPEPMPTDSGGGVPPVSGEALPTVLRAGSPDVTNAPTDAGLAGVGETGVPPQEGAIGTPVDPPVAGWYHGSPQNFDSFRTDLPTFLSDSPREALFYAENGRGGNRKWEKGAQYGLEDSEGHYFAPVSEGVWRGVDGKLLTTQDIENNWDEFDPATKYTKVLHNYNVYDVSHTLKPSEILDAITPQGVSLLKGLDAQGDNGASALLSNIRANGWHWDFTKPKYAQEAWKNILAPQLATHGIKAIRFREGSPTSNNEKPPSTLMVLDPSVLQIAKNNAIERTHQAWEQDELALLHTQAPSVAPQSNAEAIPVSPLQETALVHPNSAFAEQLHAVNNMRASNGKTLVAEGVTGNIPEDNVYPAGGQRYGTAYFKNGVARSRPAETPEQQAFIDRLHNAAVAQATQDGAPTHIPAATVRQLEERLNAPPVETPAPITPLAKKNARKAAPVESATSATPEPTLTPAQRKAAARAAKTTPASSGKGNTFLAIGEESVARRGDRKDVPVKYAIAKLNDLVPSQDPVSLADNPDYDKGLQPRDRTDNKTRTQLQQEANNFRPALMGFNPTTNGGAPILSTHDMQVESGNGRVLGLHYLKESHPEKYKGYQKWLVENAEKFGLSSKDVQTAIDAGHDPVLVRVREAGHEEKPDATSRYDDADAMGKATENTVSVIENAKRDGDRLARRDANDETILHKLEPRVGLNSPANKSFIKAWLDTLPVSEREDLFKDGRLTVQGKERLEAALQSQAFLGDNGEPDPTIMRKLQETDSNDGKLLVSVLEEIAPSLAKLNATNPDMSIGTDLARAVLEYSNLKGSAKPNPKTGLSWKLDNFLKQTSFDPPSDITQTLMRMFDGKTPKGEKARKSKEGILDALRLYHDDISPKQKAGGLLGDDTPPEISKSREAILSKAIEDANKVDETSEDMFAEPEGTPKPKQTIGEFMGWDKIEKGQNTTLNAFVNPAQVIQILKELPERVRNSPLLNILTGGDRGIPQGTGRFAESHNVAGKTVGEAVNQLNGARGRGLVLGELAAREVLDGLSTEDRAVFDRVLHHYQGLSHEATSSEPHNIPMMRDANGNLTPEGQMWRDYTTSTGSDRTQYSAKDLKKSPQMARVMNALLKHQTLVQPNLLNLREEATGTDAAGNPVFKTLSTVKFKGEDTFASLKHENGQGKGKQSTATPSKFRPTQVRNPDFNKTRTGQGEYHLGYQENIQDDFAKVSHQLAFVHLYDSLRQEGYLLSPEEKHAIDAAYAIDPAGGEAEAKKIGTKYDPSTKRFVGMDGKDSAPSQTDVGKLSQLSPASFTANTGRSTTAFIPSVVKEHAEIALRAAPTPDPSTKTSRAVMGLLVKATLATPAEAFGHAARFVAWATLDPMAAADIAKFKQTGDLKSLARAPISLAMPQLSALNDVFNVNIGNPKDAGVLEDLYKAGAMGLRPFQEAINEIHIPGLSEFTAWQHEQLMGLPKNKRGFSGFDLRWAIQQEKLRRLLEPNTETDYQRMRDYANQRRQYQPNPIELVEKMKAIAPFAGTHSPNFVSKVKAGLTLGTGLKGDTAHKMYWKLNSALAAAMGTAGVVAIATWVQEQSTGKAVDHSRQSFGDIPIGTDSDGNQVFLPMGLYNPLVNSVLTVTGLKTLLTKATNPDKRSNKDVGTDIANGVISNLNSPLLSSGMTATTGSALHFSKGRRGGEKLIQTVPTNPDGSTNYRWRITHTLADAIPLAGKPIKSLLPEDTHNAIFGADPAYMKAHELTAQPYKAIDWFGKFLMGTGLVK